METKQKGRLVRVSSPLGEDVLLFSRMDGRESLSEPFSYQLELLSEKGALKAESLLGKGMDVILTLPDHSDRYFNGIVSRFGQCGTKTDGQRTLAVYRVTLRPWLWLLTRASDCRIFQEKTVPDIVKQVFRDHGFTDFDEKLTKTYPQREYCVQYRETDFNFVSRLMEEEGIYYFFSHQKGKHTLVLADAYSAHESASGYTQVPFFDPGNPKRRERDHIFNWTFDNEIQPGCCVLTDYDFTKPKSDLKVVAQNARSHTHAELEMFDYPGDYFVTGDGNHYVGARIEELQAQYEKGSGSGNARGLACGGLFSLTDHPRSDQNREYLIVSNCYELQSDEFISTQSSAEAEDYQCSLTALESKQPFRPPRNTERPVVRGPQTAVVVGPGGDEIYTDQYGRVKVLFHWDREGKEKRNETCSCWIRVSHPWAGKNWGMVAIPRIGQEVIVSFLEGDPDRPIITGRVYNADQMPPYALPANMTQTGIQSRSSKGGSGANCNELRFEDKKGAEQVLLHAEKNQDIEVENDETHWVGHDRKKNIDHDETTTVGHDRTETVGNNETIKIGVNRTETVGSNENITIGANRTESVGANESITVAASRTHNVGQNETVTVALMRTRSVGVNEMINVGAAQEVTVGGAQTVTVGAIRALTVGASQTTTIGSSHTVDVGTDLKESIGSNHTENVGQSLKLEVGKEGIVNVGKYLSLSAGDEIVIKTGDASIIMKKDGSILIKGKDIKIEGSGKIVGKADGDMVLKGGTKVTIN